MLVLIDGREAIVELAGCLARGQPAALGVGTTKASPAGLELLFQYPVLFYQVRDDRRLFSPDPAGKRGQAQQQVAGRSHLTISFG